MDATVFFSFFAGVDEEAVWAEDDGGCVDGEQGECLEISNYCDG